MLKERESGRKIRSSGKRQKESKDMWKRGKVEGEEKWKEKKSERKRGKNGGK